MLYQVEQMIYNSRFTKDFFLLENQYKYKKNDIFLQKKGNKLLTNLDKDEYINIMEYQKGINILDNAKN